MTNQRVFLHVGLPKTGTTYLQDRLWRNRDGALRKGLLYPGDIRQAHFHAAVHIQPERYLDWVDPAHAGAWERLVAQVQGWPDSALISHELFASATPAQAAAAVAALDFAEVHLVCTVRDLGRQIPSVWQENIKNQHTSTLAEFLDGIRAHDPQQPHDPFWEFQDLPRILRNWAADLPPERVHVVTVPAPGNPPQLLWQRFISVFGLTAEDLPRDVPSGNSALDAGQIELLRRVNEVVRGNIAWARYESVVKEYLIGSILFDEQHRTAPALPASELDWVGKIADEFTADITASGYHVVGDLADLQPRAGKAGDDESMTDRELLDVVVDVLAKVVQTMPDPKDSRSVADRAKSLLRGQHRRLVAARRLLLRR